MDKTAKGQDGRGTKRPRDKTAKGQNGQGMKRTVQQRRQGRQKGQITPGGKEAKRFKRTKMSKGQKCQEDRSVIRQKVERNPPHQHHQSLLVIYPLIRVACVGSAEQCATLCEFQNTYTHTQVLADAKNPESPTNFFVTVCVCSGGAATRESECGMGERKGGRR